MIKVQVRPNEPLETALRRFKRQCNFAGIFRLAKKYTYHEKRSDKRRREDRERIRTRQRAMKKLGDGGGRRRKSKLRTSSVTPESARRAAEEKTREAEVQVEARQPAPPAAGNEAPETPVEQGTTVKIGNAEATVGSRDKGGDGAES